jgi:lysophospholipase L1-like esterase
MNKVKSLCTNLFIAISAFLLVFILLEVCAQVYIFSFAGEQSFKKYASLQQIHSIRDKLKYTPHPYLRYYPTPNYNSGKNKHNSMGYRGDEIEMPKPDGRFRIVCMGGSTTYTNNIDDYKMSYPYLLEKKLKERGYENIDVINSGVSGWTSWESLINFELRVLDLDPDMIILYHGINDIHARFIWPPEAYKGDNTGEIGTSGYITMPGILEYSTLLRILMIKAGITDSHAAIERFGRTSDQSENTYFAPLFQRQKLSNTYPDGIFKEASAKQMLHTNTPKYFKRNINNIVSIAKVKGVSSVLTSFAYSHSFKNEPRVSSEEYISAYNEMNKVLEDISDKKNVHFFDFANVFPVDKHYYIDGRHVTEEGARLKAELFANYLIENKLLPIQ